MQKCKILLVDDEQDIVFVIKKGLERHGFEVDSYSDPKKALADFRPDTYDLLVSDIRMPGLTGIQLFMELKAIDKNLRVLFLTAFEIQEKERQLLLPYEGVREFIEKPVTLQYLVNAIVRLKAIAEI